MPTFITGCLTKSVTTITMGRDHCLAPSLSMTDPRLTRAHRARRPTVVRIAVATRASELLHFPALDFRITGGLRHAVVVDGIGGVAVRSLGEGGAGAGRLAVHLLCCLRSGGIRAR